MRTIIPFTLIVVIAHVLVRTPEPLDLTHEHSGPDEIVQRTSEPAVIPYSFREFFDALMHVESGGDTRAIGDDGRSRGPYQISRAYWLDGGGSDYDRDVWDTYESESVMLGYWMRYTPDALESLDYEVLARVHNGGPRGADKESTIAYWNKVRAELLAGRNKQESRYED
jgi:hypothetical protein